MLGFSLCSNCCLLRRRFLASSEGQRINQELLVFEILKRVQDDRAGMDDRIETDARVKMKKLSEILNVLFSPECNGKRFVVWCQFFLFCKSDPRSSLQNFRKMVQNHKNL